MESKTVKRISSGKEYDHLFPKATLEVITKKKGATVSDTVKFIPQVVRETMWQTERIAPLLKGETIYDTCSNIWHFLYEHVKYKKDEDGKEQVRSPMRLWHDRFRGVDCDCFTTTVLSLLEHHNIKGLMRITKYKQDHFQHIYPIVPIGNGKYITIDCVVDEFNYEEPYTEKKDFKMDLQYLNGIEEEKLNGNVDAQDMFGWNDDKGDLGKLFKRQVASAMPEENQGDNGNGKRKRFQKFKKFAKKALNIANKANPATALLRAGILASMKLNVMKVAQKLKWAYLSEAEAKNKGADMSKFGKLKKILYKIEQIFYTAGGNPTNLKKSILSGRGNRNKEVNGLGLIDGYEIDMSGVNEYSSLPTLLEGVYQDEFVNGLEGTEGLGSAVAAGAAIASATTIMTTIAALIKSIGNMFPHKKNNKDFKEEGAANAGEGNTQSDGSEGSGSSNDAPSVNTHSDNSDTSSPPATTNNGAMQRSEQNSTNQNKAEVPENNGTNGNANKGTDPTEKEEEPKKGFKEFWDNNKKWMKPLGIGLGAATVLYIGYRVVKSKNANKSPNLAKTSQPALNGVRRRKKKTRAKHNGHHGKKSNVALM